MRTPPLNDPIAKRRILYSGRASQEEQNSLADEFIEVERFGEALELLEITKDEARLDRIEKEALTRGDTFLLLRVSRIRGSELGEGTWRKAAERALELGKYHDAFRALEQAGDTDKAEAIREEHIPNFRPWRPEGK